MRIAGFLVVGPNEKYLEGTLKEFQRLTDKTYAATNNADEKTISLLDQFGVSHYEDNREWGKHQPKIKTDLLTHIGRDYSPDWVLPLDADEQFDHNMERSDLERLADEGGVGYYFYIVNLWNSVSRYAKGLSFWNIRFFRYAPEYGLDFLNKPVHCGLAPPIAYKWGNYAPFHVKHYGLMEPEARARKVERYEKYDPNAVHKSDIYYQALKSTSPGALLDEEKLREKVREEANKTIMKGEPARERKPAVVRCNKEGKKSIVIESTDGQRDIQRYEKQGWKCEIVDPPSKKSAPDPTGEHEEENAKSDNICDTCSFEAKSSFGLRVHSRKHN